MTRIPMHDNPSNRRHANRMRITSRRALAVVCLIALVACSTLAITGCKDTRALKNIVHDQNAESVDYESGESFRIVSEYGKLIGEDTGLYEVGTAEDGSLPVNVLYVSTEPQTELSTSKFIYDENSANSSEASEGVNILPPDEQQQEQRQQEEPQESDSTNNSQQPRSNTNPNKSTQQPKNDEGDDEDEDEDDTDDGQNGDEPDDPQNPDDEPEDPSGDNPSGTGDDDDQDKPAVYDGTGDEPDLPSAGSIAAFGQVAVLVQMLGGTDADDGFTPLAAADDELCAGAFSRVFADEGVDRINNQAFTADGSGGYTPNIDQIIEAHPDTVLAYSDGMFTTEEQDKLADNNISITVVPALTSDTGILRAARNIAKMLDESTDGRSTAVYEDYKNYHDELIEEVEGDRGYGAYEGEIYDAYIKPRPRNFTAQRFTLVVDEWDFGATYDYRSTITDAGAGIGLATVGFRNSPVSYYLGVAGVVNNAAAIDTTKNSSGLLAPAWQFNPTDLNPSDIRFSKREYSDRLYTNWGTGLTKTTLSKADTKKLTMRQDGFGTQTFPVVILATERMRDSFITTARASNSIYHPFGWATTDVGTIPGTLVGRTPVYTVIDENLDTSSTTEALVVNPHGLFSSWIDGSAESFLECAWAANIGAFDNSWGGSVSTEVKAFYQLFYRYDITDGEVQAVLDGLSS